MKNKVYIILLNYKGWEDTIECLESVFKLKGVNFQVIVVDNSPTTESLDRIRKWADGDTSFKINSKFDTIVYPLISKPISYANVTEEESKIAYYEESLLLIKSAQNKGFSAGNNIALEYAIRRDDFMFCWLLNNDTVVKSDALRHQIDYYQTRASKTGIIGSVIIDYFEPTNVQALGGGILNTKTFLTKHVGEGLDATDVIESIKNWPVDYIMGASMFVSREFLIEVGILSQDYFLYFEELDWAYRAKNKGWTIDWCPYSIVYHKEGGSIGTSKNYKKRSFLSEIEFFRSRKIFFTKYFTNHVSFKFYSILLILNRIRRFQFKLALGFIRIITNKVT